MFTREEVAVLLPTIKKTALGRRLVLGRRYTGKVTPQEAREVIGVIEKAGPKVKSARTFLVRFRKLAGVK